MEGLITQALAHVQRSTALLTTQKGTHPCNGSVTGDAFHVGAQQILDHEKSEQLHHHQVVPRAFITADTSEKFRRTLLRKYIAMRGEWAHY